MKKSLSQLFMKIAIFASAFHPSLGGVEELTRQLAHALKRGGHEAIIFTERWPRDLPAVEQYESIRVYRFPFRVATSDSKFSMRLRSAVTHRLTTGGIQRQITAVLKQEKVEVVHVQCVSSNAVYAQAAALRLDLPLVVTLQGELNMDASQLFQVSSQARQMMYNALQNADVITGCSNQTVSEAQDFFGQPFGARARVIYNGIRLADFEDVAPRAQTQPYILGIGRQVPQKGFDVLLHAYAQLRAKVTNSEMPNLLLAGNGTSHQELKDLTHKLELDDHVDFVGRVDRAAAVALFKGCEFFVLPSRHEPMGIVNLEAMAAGKAVIASNVGGVPELVEDGRNGLLVPPDDSQALALALHRLVSDPEFSKRLGENGALRVQDFDWDVIAKQYLQIYQSVCANPQTRVGRQG